MCLGGSSTTTTTQEPFSGTAKDRFDSFYKQLYDSLGNTPRYGGALSAGLSQTQQQAINQLRNNTDQQFIQDTMAGKYLNPDSNPYLAKSADAIRRNMSEQFGDMTNAIDSRVNRSGFWGGSAHQGMLEKARDDLAEKQGDALNNLYGNAYSQERERQFGAYNSMLQGTGALLNAGNAEQKIADDDALRKYQAWLAEQGYNQQAVGNLLNYFNIGKNPTSTQTTEKSGGLGDLVGMVSTIRPLL